MYSQVIDEQQKTFVYFVSRLLNVKKVDLFTIYSVSKDS